MCEDPNNLGITCDRGHESNSKQRQHRLCTPQHAQPRGCLKDRERIKKLRMRKICSYGKKYDKRPWETVQNVSGRLEKNKDTSDSCISFSCPCKLAKNYSR